MLGYLCMLTSCKDSIQITDVSSSQNTLVDYPCLSSTNDCTNSFEIKGGTFNFFSSFHIDSSSQINSAVITVHGHTRNADEYFDRMISIVSSQGIEEDVLVVSPRFISLHEQSSTEDWYWNSTSWKWGMDSYMSASGHSVSSFELMDSLLSRLSDKNLFPLITNVLITGHSSGAAFVHMYSATKGSNTYNHLNLHFSVVNNQYFLHPDSTRRTENGMLSVIEDCIFYDDWPYGLNALSPYMEIEGKEKAKNNFLSNKVDYFIGELDIETSGITLGCQYEFLGDNRYEKNSNYKSYLDAAHPGNKHFFTTLPNLGHTTNSYNSPIFIQYLESIFQPNL